MAETIVSGASINLYSADIEVDAIKTIVDSLNAYIPDTGSMTDIETKVDNAQSDITDLDADDHILMSHIHNKERWFGAAVTPSGQTHIADDINTATTWFTADAGNNAWGSWLQILGSSDTPYQVGMTLFDFHRLYVTEIERGGLTHFIQIAWGVDGATALAAGNYTEIVYKPVSAANAETPIQLICNRIPSGTKVWVRVRIPTANTGTFSFYAGIHEYAV
jgi:hypothetical protein